jgi:ATP-binding cassette subfamily B protein
VVDRWGSAIVASWRRSPRLKAVRLLWSASKPLTFALGFGILLNALGPVMIMVAMGRMVGRMPAAFGHGFGSPAGHSLFLSLVVVGIAFFVAMMATPYQEWLTAAIKIRLTFALQTRLMRAVSEPIGIAHLEDPAVLDRVALAQGTLMNFFPADAPAVLGVVVGYRLMWLTGCLIVGTFRWWLGIALVVLWQWTRRPILHVIQEHIAAFGGNAAVMRRADYFHALATTPTAAKELRVFGLGGWVVERYRAYWTEGMAELWRIRAGMTAKVAWVSVVLLGTYVGACAVIAKALFDGDIDVGRAALLLPVLFLTMTGGGASYEDLGLEWQLSGLPELDALEEDLAQRRRALVGTVAPDGVPALAFEVRDVGFQYPGATSTVFDGLDLVIPAGKSTAIVGANGAGKTTLVKLLARLHDPTAGTIVVDGKPLDTFDASAWQRKVAVVFQDFAHLPFSAAENIGLGAREFRDDRAGIVAAAERAGIAEFIESLPLGWDTPLSRQYTGGVDLSGGQWQRVALARALFAARHCASVLVLDEPTSWLDVRGEAEFFERFLEITEGLTTIVISHRFSTVRLADQICVLRNGRSVELGSHDELVAHNGLYARMFRLQASRFKETSA